MPTATTGMHPSVNAILDALGLGGRMIRRFQMSFAADDLVKMYGEIIDDGIIVSFDEIVSEDQVQRIATALQLEKQTGFQIAADWLDDHDYSEAATALREAH